MLSLARSYRAGSTEHQWDGHLTLRTALPALLLSTAATVTAAAALGSTAWSNTGQRESQPAQRSLARLADRPPPPLLLRDVAPTDALAINHGIPLSSEANPAAQPFRFTGDSAAYARALVCLAAATYYEAGSETVAGKHAVAQVVLNRVRHPAFAKSICGVVFEGSTRSTGCQFSFTCDGSLRRRPSISGWHQSVAVARAALGGTVYPPVGFATHYHANYVVPYWATSLAKNAVIGTHIFYRWPASWGRPSAFSRAYDGNEADPRLLLQAALRETAPDAAQPGELVLESDPRVELVSIVDFLASDQAEVEQTSYYRHQIRSYFWSHSDHLAVQIYRQMTAEGSQLSLPQLNQIIMHYSAPPELQTGGRLPPELVSAAGGEEALAGLISALREFAAHTDFQRFWQDQQPVYADFVAQARAAAVAAKGETSTDVPVELPRVIVAPLLQNAMVAGCGKPSTAGSGSWLIVAADSFADARVRELLTSGVGCGGPPRG